MEEIIFLLRKVGLKEQSFTLIRSRVTNLFIQPDCDVNIGIYLYFFGKTQSFFKQITSIYFPLIIICYYHFCSG